MDNSHRSRRVLGQALLSGQDGEDIAPLPTRSDDVLPGHRPTAGHNWEGSTSIAANLEELAFGDPITARGEQWRLTRAVVHLEDSWKGRITCCPKLKDESVRKVFRLRWHIRRLDVLAIHLLMALSFIETPAWCVDNGMCFWSCYPDFSRNWHLDVRTGILLEGILLSSVAAIAMLDVYLYGHEYWSGSWGPGALMPTRMKHSALGLYVFAFILSISVSFDVHEVVGYLRLLLYLSVHRRTMLVVAQIRHILGAVVDIWVLIFFNIVLFAWMGTVLFDDTAEGRDVFPNMFEACWRLFVLFTTTNFPDIMLSSLNSVRASFIYFAAFVILNVFFLAPLSLAFIFNVFRGGQKGIPRMEEDIRNESVAAAFKLLDERNTGHVPLPTLGAFLLEVHSMRGVACRELARLQDLIEEVSIRRPEQTMLDLSDFKDTARVLDRNLQHAEWITEAQWYFPNMYKSAGFQRLTAVVRRQKVTLWPGWAGIPTYEVRFIGFIHACLLLTSLVALITFSKTFDSCTLCADLVQVLIVAGFCTTMAVVALVRGWYNCIQRPTFVFNLLVTAASVVVIFLAFTGLAHHWGWRVVRALRVLHLASIIVVVPRLNFLTRTLLIMTRRAATPVSVLFAWAFFMATLGPQLFGGMVCVGELSDSVDEQCGDETVMDNEYTTSGMTLLNFNDVPTAFVTLFVLFVVNDWYVIVDEFSAVSHTGWARLFFITNYIMGVAVILNLVTTVVINSFWDEYKDTVKPATLRQRNVAEASANVGEVQSPKGSSSRQSSPQRAVTGNSEDSMILDETIPGWASVVNDSRWGWHPLTSRDTVEGGHEPGAHVGEEESQGAAAGLEHMHPRHQHPVPRRGGGVVGADAGAAGDQEGMEAERAIARRASRRRVDRSGIT